MLNLYKYAKLKCAKRLLSSSFTEKQRSLYICFFIFCRRKKNEANDVIGAKVVYKV